MFGIALLTINILYIISRKPSNLQVHLLFMNISAIIAMVIYLGEIISTNPAELFIYAKLGYLGKSFITISSVCFIMDYCHFKLPKWVRGIFYGLSIFICLCAVTSNENQRLFYTGYEYAVAENGYCYIKLGHGPVYNLNLFINIFYFLVNLILGFYSLRKAKTTSKRFESLLIFGIIFSGIIGYVLFLTGITAGYDTTLPAFVLSGFFLFILFFRYNIYDSISIAKDKALDNSENGVVVFDNNNDIVYSNTIGKLILSKLTNDSDDPKGALYSYFNDDEFYELDEQIFKISILPINDHKNDYGILVEFIESTAYYNYSSKLEQDVEERTRDIKNIQRSIISSLANIVEARDEGTGMHIKNTSDYVRLICYNLRDLGYFSDILTEEYIDILVDVAPLHDIGKISISDNILKKPGRLTQDEYDEIKNHSLIGAEIIEKNLRGVEIDKYVDMAVDVAKYHHEKYNGKGYPNGIKGDDIPLSGRIMALADVFDALTTKRCYKQAYGFKESLDIVKADSGSHFDPRVVEAFVRGIESEKIQ